MLNKVLYIGDVHATPDSIQECERLIDWCIDQATLHDVDAICFLGDLFHTHSIIHLPVLSFWQRAFKKIHSEMDWVKIIALVGNHDKSGVTESTDNALMLYDKVWVVNKPCPIENILFVPYMASNEEFLKTVNEYEIAKGIVCHQTFDGSQMENGFYTKDGVDLTKLNPNYEFVISGHIHRAQTIAKPNTTLYYIGTPRWRTVADANTPKHVWVVDHEKQGAITKIIKLPTDEVCEPIYQLKDTPASPVSALPKGKVTVDIHGPPDYVAKRKVELASANVRIRTFPTQQKVIKIKESDGLTKSIEKFYLDYTPNNKTPKEILWKTIQQRIQWLK